MTDEDKPAGDAPAHKAHRRRRPAKKPQDKQAPADTGISAKQLDALENAAVERLTKIHNDGVAALRKTIQRLKTRPGSKFK